MHESQTDADLDAIHAVQRGDRNAFRGLVDRHGDAVFSVLLRLLANRELAEDLAQETFIRAYGGIGGFRGDARVRTWLIQIALNLARDQVRATAREPVVVSFDRGRRTENDAGPALVDHHAEVDPLRSFERHEIAERLDRELARLPAGYREVFLLKHIEGCSYDEIAGMTGDSIGSLKVRAHRARCMLRQRLAASSENDHGPSARTLSRR